MFWKGKCVCVCVLLIEREGGKNIDTFYVRVCMCEVVLIIILRNSVNLQRYHREFV